MKTDTPWTLQEDSTLRLLWDDGTTSTGKIGMRLHRTKNMIVGRAHRLGLTPKPSPIKLNPDGMTQRRAMIYDRRSLPAGHPDTWGVISGEPWPGPEVSAVVSRTRALGSSQL